MPVADSDDIRGMTPSPEVKRSRGEDAAPAPGHSRGGVPDDYRQIKGWGVDLDPKNRPMVPREFPSDVNTARGPVTARQVPDTKIHVSNEQPDLTPVFGTSCPPQGLSGMLRDYAFEYGEGTNRHWMTLLLADRIDVIENLFIDAVRGKIGSAIGGNDRTVLRHTTAHHARAYSGLAATALGALAVGLLIRRAMRD